MRQTPILVEDRTIPEAEGDLHAYERVRRKGWDYFLKSRPAAPHRKAAAWFSGHETCLAHRRDASEEGPPLSLRPSVYHELASLRTDIREIRAQLLTLTAVSKPRVVVSNPLVLWCEAHHSDLLAYPDAFVAIDPAKGIVCHATTNSEFATHLASLPPAYRATLMLTHTSMYK